MVVTLPSSKSLAHRYLIANALSDTHSEIVINGWSRDLMATRDCLHAMLSGESDWNCGESATTLRLLTPIAAVMGLKGAFTMGESLKRRPTLPFERKEHYVVPGNVSSQFISGLLMALPLADWDSTISVEGTLESASYVGLTEQVLEESGVKFMRSGDSWRIPGRQHYHLKGRIVVEGDWTHAATFLAMGVQVAGLREDSRQGDSAAPMLLKADCVDIAQHPDLYPVLAVHAAFTGRRVRFMGTERLRLKESDRLAATEAMIEALRNGDMVITRHDHRIAMAAAVGSVLSGKRLLLDDYACVEKSYPKFWDDFARVRPIRLGLLGAKLSHSLSPLIHRMFGDYQYRLHERSAEELARFFRTEDFVALNVTTPYKERVLEFCDELSPLAKRLGNVNLVLRREDGSLYGDNTDYHGFERLCASVMDLAEYDGRQALILGKGGASKTAAAVFSDHGAKITIDHRGDNLDYDAEIIVNATPVGTLSDVAPIDISRFHKAMAVIDLVYNPSPTCLVRTARERGLKAVDGMVMLIAQAARTAELANVDAAKAQNIYFYGPPGAGKSTIAKAAAFALNRPFVDLDAEIERLQGATLSAIFAGKGEKGFRRIESGVFGEVAKRENMVVALGGGTLLAAESRALARETGRIIPLTADTDTLWRRMRGNMRPLAPTREALEKLMMERKEHYDSFGL